MQNPNWFPCLHRGYARKTVAYTRKNTAEISKNTIAICRRLLNNAASHQGIGNDAFKD